MPVSLLTDSDTALGTMLEVALAGRGGMILLLEQEDNLAEAQSAAVVNMLHHDINITSHLAITYHISIGYKYLYVIYNSVQQNMPESKY